MVLCALLLVLSACGKPAPTTAPCPPHAVSRNDFGNLVQVGRIRYNEQYTTGRPLTDADIGAVLGQVRCTVFDTAFDWRSQWPDGYAVLLPVGTQIYALRGYSARFRVAERSSGSWRLYEAVDVPDARSGADLLDLAGKVVAIEILPMPTDEAAPAPVVQRIDDSAQVAALVAAILAAPLDPTRRDANPTRALITFRLRDGTTSTRMYFPSVGALGNGLLLPQAVRDVFDAHMQIR